MNLDTSKWYLKRSAPTDKGKGRNKKKKWWNRRRKPMKAIMKSIRPQHVANILNLIKKLEISTTAPKDWKDYLSGKTDKKPAPIDVFIYTTRDISKGFLYKVCGAGYRLESDIDLVPPLNGKVVAKFTLKEVEDFVEENSQDFLERIRKGACFESVLDLLDFIDNKIGYAWHIGNLVVFDKPKEISEFYKWTDKTMGLHVMPKAKMVESLTNAPQSYCYIEV